MAIKKRKLLSLENQISYIFVPTLVFTTYCGLLRIGLKYTNLVGVNQFFVFNLIKLLIFILPCEIILIITSIIIMVIKHRKISFSRQKNYKISLDNLLLLILPITPVVQYISINTEILSITDSLIVLLFFIIFSSVLIICIPYLFTVIGNTRVLIALGLAFTFLLTLMAYLSQLFSWFQEGNFLIQLAFFLAFFLIIYILINQKYKKFLYIFLIINFIVNTTFQFFSQNTLMKTESQISHVEYNLQLSFINEKVPESTPDIFFLVYEAYVPNETLLAYGFNDQAQEKFLQENGFKIYPNIYSVGSPTINSLSRVFNISANMFNDQRHGIAGDGIVQNILKNLGYTTYGYVSSNWIYRGYGSKYDFSYPNTKIYESDEMLISAILIGEFQSDLFFDITTYDEFIKEKRSLFEDNSSAHTFAYIHSGYPGHSQVSGSCQSNEIELYLKRLEISNREMQEDIEILLNAHPNSIIIIAGDHGPYITNSCFGLSNNYETSEISRLDIQDRFATFLAIKWPSGDYEEYDEIKVLQDLFPVVFAYMYDDISILDIKIEPEIMDTEIISGATVKNGIIYGGVNDGQQLFFLSE